MDISSEITFFLSSNKAIHSLSLSKFIYYEVADTEISFEIEDIGFLIYAIW